MSAILRTAAHRWWIGVCVGVAAVPCADSAAAAKPLLTAPSVATQHETATLQVSARGARGCRLTTRGPRGRRQGLRIPGRHSSTVRLAISNEAATGKWTLRVRCHATRSAAKHLSVQGNKYASGAKLFDAAKITKVAGKRPPGYVEPRRRQNPKGDGVPRRPVGIGSPGEDGGRAERAIAWAMGEVGSETYYGLGLRFVADAYGGQNFPRSATILANALGPREGDLPPRNAPPGALLWFNLGDEDRGRNDGHVGISLGDGRMIHTFAKVRIDDVDKSQRWLSRYRGWTPAPEDWPGLAPPPLPPPPPPAVDVAPPPPAPAPVGKVITIDNRITNGMSMLQDGVPLRLTTQARTYCGIYGCNIDGTERMTGDTYDAAVCQTRGERYTNGNDHDPADDANPERVESTLYYGVKLTGTTIFGYTSEVWVRATDRGGLGLPAC